MRRIWRELAMAGIPKCKPPLQISCGCGVNWGISPPVALRRRWDRGEPPQPINAWLRWLSGRRAFTSDPAACVPVREAAAASGPAGDAATGG